MSKTTGPGGVGARPGFIPQQETPGLNQKEQAKVLQQQGQKISSSDAARVAQQAGFQRLQKKPGKGLDLGDSSKSPIPLPEEDTELESWNPERLESAQGNLTLASAQFGEVAKGGEAGETSMAGSIVGSSFMPTEGDIADMEDLAHRPAKQPVPMLEEVSTSVGKLFGIEFPDDVPVGHKVLAAGLVVAGEQGSVKVGKGGLEERELAGGIKKVTERGNQAVTEAQNMNKGITKELAVQRTFMFKR